MADRNTESAAPAAVPKPHRKRPSPFRIKTGSVVALRMLPTGNTVVLVTPEGATVPIDFGGYSYVWAPPCPGRDEGRGLLGRHVRCFLPVVVPNQKLRAVEGPVVGVHHTKPTKVHLLIDKADADALPFLPRVPDATSADTAAAASSKASRRHAMLEERIRGSDKVIVQVRLRKTGPAGRVDDGKQKSLQWAVLKLVPSRLLHPHDVPGKRASLDGAAATGSTNVSRPRFSVRHVGDGHDSPEQQVANFRWLASRYHDLLFRNWTTDQPMVPQSGSSAPILDTTAWARILSTGFVGVVKEVNVSAVGDGSLASVRLERLILPEHTATGRPETHHVYHDLDHDQLTLQVPIEQLIVIAKSLERQDDRSPNPSPPEDPYMLDRFILSKSYSLDRDTYIPLQATQEKTGLDIAHPCHRCRHTRNHLIKCKSLGCPYAEPSVGDAAWCRDCCSALGVSDDSGLLPCASGLCDCPLCESFLGAKLQDDLYDAAFSAMKQRRIKTRGRNDLSQSLGTVDIVGLIDFGLPKFILDSSDHPNPAPRPISRKTVKRNINIFVASADRPKAERRVSKEVPRISDQKLNTDGYNYFMPTCARHNQYDAISRIDTTATRPEISSSRFSTDRPRNLREALKDLGRGDVIEKDEKPVANGRAARANQRRFMKDLGAYGLIVDSLASREPQIRFDRSSIHAWGVFADEDIAADEMIIEYRGEIISNAVAEKREKLYEQEKIGSDYMFRIDNQTVCDATKLGNVARFINASCEPNCYTKIITIDGAKRIVIYSKCAIRAGEELAYDYKFPLEYDPTKRIPCHCGAKECRGFMNWDKKYIVVESPENTKSDASDASVPDNVEENGQASEESSEDGSCASMLDSPEGLEEQANVIEDLDSGFDTFYDGNSSCVAGIETSMNKAEEPIEDPRQLVSTASKIGSGTAIKRCESHECVSGEEGEHPHSDSVGVEQSNGKSHEFERSGSSSHSSHMALQNDFRQDPPHAPLRKRNKLAADANQHAVAAGQHGPL